MGPEREPALADRPAGAGRAPGRHVRAQEGVPHRHRRCSPRRPRSEAWRPTFPVLIAAAHRAGGGRRAGAARDGRDRQRDLPPEQRGRALGTMGGAAAIAGALGPTIGGVLTSALSWRAVLLVNVPLAVARILLARRAVAARRAARGRAHRIDVPGTVLLRPRADRPRVRAVPDADRLGLHRASCVPLAVFACVAGVAFVRARARARAVRSSTSPAARHRNYLGAHGEPGPRRA